MEAASTTISGAQYEAALGGYLVLFNRLEVQASEVHFGALHRLRLQHLFRSEAKLVERLVPMEIAITALKWHKPDFAMIRQINGKRNELAHGHLHQDPNTGEWQLEGVHKIKRSISEYGEYSGMVRESEVTPPSLQAIATESGRVQAAISDLTTCMANYWFDDP